MARRLPKTITPEEFDRLLRQPSRRAPTGIRNRAVMRLMWDAGLRVSEVCNLHPRDLNREKQTVGVRRGKGGKDRSSLYVPVQTWDALERWAAIRPTSKFFFCTLGGNQVNDRYLRTMVARYSQRAGVFKLTDDNTEAPLNPHMLRHSYATRLIENGVPIHEVQAALGHSSAATTSRYLHVRNGRLAASLKAALDEDHAAPDGRLEALVERAVAKRLEAMGV